MLLVAWRVLHNKAVQGEKNSEKCWFTRRRRQNLLLWRQWSPPDEQEGLELVNPRTHLTSFSGHAIHGKLFAKSPSACCSPSLGAEHPPDPFGLVHEVCTAALCQDAFETKPPEADPFLRLQYSKTQVHSLSLQGAITLKKLSISIENININMIILIQIER